MARRIGSCVTRALELTSRQFKRPDRVPRAAPLTTLDHAPKKLSMSYGV